MIALIASLWLGAAQAQTGAKDWKLVTEMDPVLQTAVCRAYTQVSTTSVPVELSLSFPTDFAKPPIVVLRLPPGSGVDRAFVQVANRESEEFILLSAAAAPGETDVLWYVPLDMAKLVNVVANANFLPVRFSQNGKDVTGRVSLAGSAATINQVATCLKASRVLPTDFFEQLNATLDRVPVGSAPAAALLDHVLNAYTFYLQIGRTTADLAKLRADMKPLVKRESDAMKALVTAQANLDKAQQAVDRTQGAINDAEQRLARIPAELADLESRKGPAEQLFNEKKAAYDAIAPEARRLEAEVESARARVNQLNGAIQQRRELITANENQIRRKQSEARELESSIANIDSRLQPMERRRIELQHELNSYNVEIEKRKILNDDFSYRRAKDELEDQRRRQAVLRNQLERARGDLNRAEDQLRQCRARPGNPNCAQEEARVNQERAEVERLRSQLEDARRRVQQLEQEIQRLELAAERRAIEGRQRIADNLRRVEVEIQDLRFQRERAEDSLRRIEQVEIPRLQNEISRARTEIPSLENSLADARQDQADSQRRLDAYKASVGFDRVEREYVQARNTYRTILSGIDERKAEQDRLTKNLGTLKARLAKEQAEVARLTPARDQAQALLNQIQDQLRPMREQEQAYVQALESMRLQYTEFRKLYQALAAMLLSPR